MSRVHGLRFIDDEARRRHLVRAVVASTIGTTVEWYEFFLHGSAAALIFPKLFFSGLDRYLANVLSYFTFYAGSVDLPIGAASFGHWGDRIGRKALLVTTMPRDGRRDDGDWAGAD